MIEKIKKLANLFPHADKVLHVIAGFMVAMIASIFFKDWAMQFGMALLAGGAKEFYDNWKYNAQGKQPFIDWGCTILGGIIWVLI